MSHLLSFRGQLRDWIDEDDFDDFDGLDMLGADPVVTIPTAGANYTDAKTVTAVQAALASGRYGSYDLGTTGPNHDGVDGTFGRRTKLAIEKMQTNTGLLVTGTINEDVIMALKVTPGVLPPGVTIQGRAALQAQVALDAATLAEHAQTPGDVQQAAQAAVDATTGAEPPLPPEVLQAARDALAKAKKVTTPAQVQAVKQEVKQAAQTVANKVAPSWWLQPAWAGGWERWKVALLASGGVVALGGAFAWLVSGGSKTVAAIGLGAKVGMVKAVRGKK